MSPHPPAEQLDVRAYLLLHDGRKHAAGALGWAMSRFWGRREEVERTANVHMQPEPRLKHPGEHS